MELTINDLKQGKIYVVESEKSGFICCFDRLEYCPERGKKLIMDFFSVVTSKGGKYLMKFVCNDLPLTLNPISIREATEEEIFIFLIRVRAEILNYQISTFENDDAGQKEGKRLIGESKRAQKGGRN